MSLLRPLKLGRLDLVNNLALAPMAGITGAPLRVLAAEGGAGLVVTEMISCESIRYANRKTFKMLELLPGEHPVAVQLFGADPASAAYAAKEAEKAGADAVDFNAGCPVKKILRSGSGCALMKEPARLCAIIEALRGAVKIPVTVKFRVGLEQGEVLSPALARAAEAAGSAAITLHGRYASQFHAGPVDFDALAATAAAVKIPVFANGGAEDAESARRLLETGCAGVAVGRAAVFNPFVFREIAAGLEGRALAGASDAERVKLFMRFLELSAGLYGEAHGLSRARKLVGYWLKGLPNSASARAAFMRLTTLKEARELLIQYY
jgi:tRNA-dihydrouridine synthase B